MRSPVDIGGSCDLAEGPPELAGERRLMVTRLVISDDLALESRDDRHVILVNTASAARMKLSHSAYRFLKTFESPRRLDELVPDLTALLPQIRMLVDRRMLVDADAPVATEMARLRAAVAYKFCGAPAHAKASAPDFLILGVPYDLGGDIDSRLAPALIRQKSLDYSYRLEFGAGRPRGWFDVNRGAWILRGATLADAGDVPVDYGESQARYFERVGRALEECLDDRSVPVILGGDRSVTRAAIAGLRPDRALTVVQISPDMDSASHLSRMDEVERVVSLGSASALRERGLEETVRAWGDALSVYLSIDLAIATEASMKADTGGLPPGLTLHELKELIAAIGRVHRIVGIDLVGLDLGSPSRELSAIMGCHLALSAMSAAYDRI